VDYADALNKCEFDAIADQRHYFGVLSRRRRVRIAANWQIAQNSFPSL
jgi:hypothetical protein